jgi:putative ABC transport system permease protein
VLVLILTETMMVAAVRGGAGLALAKPFTLRGDPTGGLLPFFYLPLNVIALGFALAIAMGLMAGILPALFAMRLRVIDALRKV